MAIKSDDPMLMHGAGPRGPDDEPLAKRYPDIGEPPKINHQVRPDHCIAENQGGHEVAGK